ncbi:MAG: Lrp/AsnC ligand binding domain-containing protein [Chitinispirillaceae bacterium]|nr:Lrp/AsnC ligand binding domain-containing protein [Chitinispirillaceae bacterium]
MVTAIVLLHVERKSINQIADIISNIESVSEVYSVSGRYDLVALIRTKNNESLSDIVTNKMLQIDGIITSETMLALECFSKFELEKFFSVGD